MSEKAMAAMGVPKDFFNVTLENFDADPVARDAVGEIISDISGAMNRRTNLLITGKPRVGKTMLASIILRAAHDNAWICRFVPFAVYVRQLRKRMSLQNVIEHHTDDEALDRWTKLNHRIDSYFGAELLVLDDVGKEDRTAYVVREFEYMLRRRHDRGLSTIITTNVLPSDMAETYGEEVDAFLNEAYRRIGVVRKAPARR